MRTIGATFAAVDNAARWQEGLFENVPSVQRLGEVSDDTDLC
jgi:hypothetical protein